MTGVRGSLLSGCFSVGGLPASLPPPEGAAAAGRPSASPSPQQGPSRMGGLEGRLSACRLQAPGRLSAAIRALPTPRWRDCLLGACTGVLGATQALLHGVGFSLLWAEPEALGGQGRLIWQVASEATQADVFRCGLAGFLAASMLGMAAGILLLSATRKFHGRRDRQAPEAVPFPVQAAPAALPPGRSVPQPVLEPAAAPAAPVSLLGEASPKATDWHDVPRQEAVLGELLQRFKGMDLPDLKARILAGKRTLEAVDAADLTVLRANATKDWASAARVSRMREDLANICTCLMAVEAYRRGSFSEGSFIYADPEGKLAQYLRPDDLNAPKMDRRYSGEAGIYRRISTHLPKFTDGHTWGVDLKTTAQAQYGGHTHILLKSFMHKKRTFLLIKPEPVGLGTWTDTLIHGKHLFVSILKHYSGFSGPMAQGATCRRERVPEALLKQFNEFLDDHQANLTLKVVHQVQRAVGGRCQGIGISAMWAFLSAWSNDRALGETSTQAQTFLETLKKRYPNQDLSERIGDESNSSIAEVSALLIPA